MDKKVLLLTLLAGLLGVGTILVVWLSGEQLPPLSTAHAAGQPTDPAAASAALVGGPTDASFAGAARGEVRATAAVASASGLPLPENARWVPVLVIDAATREPAAGVSVGWVSEQIEQYYESLDPTDRDQMFLWQSVDLQVERAGWRTTTDEHGIARVTFQRWTTVIAGDEERFGQLNLHENTIPPPGGYVLELRPELQLTVQVVDDAGEPAAGVLVAIAAYDEKDQMQHYWGWGPLARTREPDGIAVLRHLQRLDDDEHDDPADPRRWRVRTFVPALEDPGVALTLERLPTEPVVLRLPACGRVRVRAEALGRPVPAFVGATLHEFSDRRRRYYAGFAHDQQPVDPDGWVRFGHLPLGREFVASSYTSGLSTRFAGPIARGQEVSVVIAPENDAILLGGRMVDAERRPLHGRQIQFEAEGPNLHTYVHFRTDDDGRFLISLGSAREDNLVEQLQFEVHHRKEPPLRLQLPARTLRAGFEDLGDLTLSGGALIVGGRFVRDDGPHEKAVSFWLERFTPDADPAEQWQSVDDILQHQDGTGRFELRGTVPPGRLRLVFGSHDQLPMEPIEFDRGRDDLEVRIDAGHPLAATLLQHKGMPMEGLYAQLVPSAPTSASAADGKDEEHRYRAEPWTEQGERSHLQWQALPAGSYTLALHLWAQAGPLLRIPDVQVPGPAGGDPRLADIDLRASTRTVLLRLFDADGKPLDGHGVAFATDQDPAAEWRGTEIYQEATKVLLPASGATELLLAISGYRPRRVPVTGDQVDVRLDAWPTLELVVAGVPELPKKATLRARLRPTTGSEASYRSQWSNGRRGELLEVPGHGAQVTDGRAMVPVGDGPHRVVLELFGNRQRIALTGVEAPLVLPNSQRVHVSVPAASWAEALAKYQPPAEKGGK